MPTAVKTGWLKDSNGDKFAPKTLTSQVQTSDGIMLEDKIQADINAILANVATKNELASAKTEIIKDVIAALPKYNGGVS